MKRDIAQLSTGVYDVLIIGGGIYGAWTAWDAALRGLSVALVDKGDFGSATSSNTMKIIHGGLRYLQQADFGRMRESIRERKILMKVAPYLVHPLPFLMPTYGHFMKSKEIMSIALMINGIIGFDRNWLIDPQKHLPRGLVISRDQCLRLFPGVNQEELTGGAVWYDCQVYNSERMILSILRSAEKAQAVLANYVEVTRFLLYGSRVIGVKARDVLTGDKLDIRARVVINTTGPWVNEVLHFLNGSYNRSPRVLLSKAMNIVVNRQLIPKYAVGVSSPFEFKNGNGVLNKGFRLLFIVPWREYSLIGTTYVPFDDSPNNLRVTERDIQNFIYEINRAYPAASLKRGDISFFHCGLLPMDGVGSGEVRLTKKYQIWDHAKFDGTEGLVSVIGAKYTTARAVAEKAIDLVFKKLGKKSPMCLTNVTPIYGGHIEQFSDFLTRETGKRERELDRDVIRHLIYNYGSEYHRVLKYINDNSDWKQTLDVSRVIKAEIVYGIREEMAQKLTDVVFRRTELGSGGNPGDTALKTCAAIMAKEFGWDEYRIQTEIGEVKAVFSTLD